MENIVQNSISCKLCWWREGDRCYLPKTLEREQDGTSKKIILLTDKCDEFANSRKSFLAGQIIK